jgi:hypothetical protein
MGAAPSSMLAFMVLRGRTHNRWRRPSFACGTGPPKCVVAVYHSKQCAMKLSSSQRHSAPALDKGRDAGQGAVVAI